MSVTKLDFARSLTDIFEDNSFLMLFTAFYESQVDKRLKNYLALCFVDSHGQLSESPLITNNLDYFSLVFQLFTQVLDFCSHGESRSDFGLHGIKNRKVRVGALVDSYTFGLVSQVPDFYSDLVQLVHFNVLEHHF